MTTMDDPRSVTAEAEREAIARVPERIVEAWAEHDADAFANVFVDDGTMILPGVYRNGKSEIRSFMAAAFADTYHGTQVIGQPINLVLLTTDSAVLTTVGGVLRPGERELPDNNAVRASWVVVKRDGQWRLAAYQNSPRDLPTV